MDVVGVCRDRIPRRHFLLVTLMALCLMPAVPAAAQHWERYLCLDGINDYAVVADNASLDLGTGATDDFTIETFFYVPDLTNTTMDTLIWKQGSYGLYVIYYTSQADRFIFRIYTGYGASDYVYLYANVNLGVGWHHVAAVWDNEYSSSWDYLALYVDGARVAYSDSNLEMTPGLINTTSAVYVGAYAGVNPTVGGMEETRLSSVVRYSGGSYTVPASPFVSDADTRALWHFNAAPGASAFADSSAYGNTLSGSGGAQTCGDPCPAITITPGTLPDGVRDTAYSDQALEASGGTAPYSFSVSSGSLPPGLVLSSAGVLSGTPTTAASYPFTVTAIDANDCTGGHSYTITVTLPAASGATSTISASPESLAADGVSTSTITVQLKDAGGNDLTTSGGTVELFTNLGSLSAVTDNGNGTYTATLTSTTTGEATVSGTINASGITDTATVTFVPGPAAGATSTIDASPASVTANGTSTSTITVQLKDANSNNLTASGGTVELSTNRGTLSAVTDNANGTYTATLTSTTTGDATVSGTINASGITDTATVTFVPGPAAGATSTIDASPASLTANGTSISTITVQLKDANGNNLTASGGTVELSTNLGNLSAVTDNGNGTYTAALTSTTTGDATVSGTINASAITDTAMVTLVAGPASAASSTITAFPTTVAADGVSSSTVTVQLKDANGNHLTTGGDTVTLLTDLGTLTGVVDGGDGTYTAVLSSTSAGVATVSGTVNGSTLADTAVVTFNGVASLTTSTITASPTSIPADGFSTSTVTVRLKDANGNPLNASGGTVVLSTDRGALSPVTDNGNGTYTATLTSSTTGGSATVTGTLEGAAFSSSAAVAFTFAAPSNLVATHTSATQVEVIWTGHGGHHYQIFRASSGVGPYAPVGTSVSPSFTDSDLSSGVAYLYKALAVDGAENPSGFSNVDVATTVVFTDDPLTTGATEVDAVHFTQLRTAVNAVRITAGLASATFTDASLTGVIIKRIHLIELRAALDAALSALGLPAISYTDPTIVAGVTKIRAAHSEDLRNAVE